MKADPSAQRRLLDLQGVDTALLQLAHKKSTLPVIAEIKCVRADQATLGERLTAAETRAYDADRVLRQAEADLEPVRQRRARDQKRIDDGTVTDAKALRSLIDEVAHLDRRISDLEDGQLEAMELAEAHAAERDSLKAEADGIESRVAGLLDQYRAQAAELDQQAAELKRRREALAAGLPEDLVALYDKIAGRGGGVGAAALHNGRRCSGCGLEANAADIARYQAAAADEIVRCEECGRILVRGVEE